MNVRKPSSRSPRSGYGRAHVRVVSLALVSLVSVVSLVSPSTATAQTRTPAPLPEIPSSPPSVAIDLAFEKYVLPNGLEVILHEDHRTPVVAVSVWYHVGSKDEAPGRNGFAHLFEHMMFQGSKNVPEDTYFKFLEKAGASETNGSTSTDRTNYYEAVPKNELPLALWLESDRMGFLLDHAGEETFAGQRDVVKNERRENYENAPYGLVRKFVAEALYPADHPYHRLTIGTPEDLDAAKLDDVRAFFRRYYVPNNATLTIAGDIDPVAVKALVAKYFASIAKGAPADVRTAPVPVTVMSERRLAVEADVELARVQITWPTPPIYAPGDGDLDAAGAILSRGKSSRLYKRLVYDLQLAQDVTANQTSLQLASTFDISVTIKKGKDPLKVLAIVDAELDKLRSAPVADAELERVRPGLLSGLVYPLESVSTRAEVLNSYNQLAGDPGYLDKDLARYRALTSRSVSEAIVKYLHPKNRIVTIVTPTRGAPRAGRLAGGAS